jgi:1,4-dihydroxy-2-naphthoate octaprenyltransferase
MSRSIVLWSLIMLYTLTLIFYFFIFFFRLTLPIHYLYLLYVRFTMHFRCEKKKNNNNKACEEAGFPWMLLVM